MTDTPLFGDPLYGLRFWRVDSDERGDWLVAPHQNTRWPPGGEWLHAECPTAHDAPAADCDCGVHAWHPRRHTARDVLAVRGAVAGIIEAQGAVEVHEDGFRAARARPYALVATPGSNRARIDRLAARYDATVLELSGPAALLAWCREHGIGLDEDVVAELLGSGDSHERARARFRRAWVRGLRVAAAFAIAAALVVLGLQLVPEPQDDHELFGRSGPIHKQ